MDITAQVVDFIDVFGFIWYLLGFVVCFNELNREVIMELQELNKKVCELFGIDASQCVKLTIEFDPLYPPKATAEMPQKATNDEIVTTLYGYKHLVKAMPESDEDKIRKFICSMRNSEVQSFPIHELFDSEFGDGEFVRIFGAEASGE